MKKGIHYYVLSSSIILSRIVGDLHSSLLESGMNKDDENVVERDNDDKNSKHVVQNGTSREENRTQASRLHKENESTRKDKQHDQCMCKGIHRVCASSVQASSSAFHISRGFQQKERRRRP